MNCVVIVPIAGHIEPACEASLVELERRGYPVRRVRGHANIDYARSHLATEALKAGYDETMWIDSDVSFDPAAVDKLRAHNLPISCGIYVKKGQAALACQAFDETRQFKFGEQGGLTEILYAAGGFLHVRKQVYDDMQEKFALPLCNERFDSPLVPYFMPMLLENWYLAEDFSFCERARQCGHKIMADTSIRLWHHGSYPYSYEDMEPKRFGTVIFNVK